MVHFAVVNEAPRQEDVWGNRGIAAHILNLGTRLEGSGVVACPSNFTSNGAPIIRGMGGWMGLRIGLGALERIERLARYVSRNIEKHSRNHCCSRKAASITYSEWVFVAISFLHALHIHHIAICFLSDCAVFFHVISLMARFSKTGDSYGT